MPAEDNFQKSPPEKNAVRLLLKNTRPATFKLMLSLNRKRSELSTMILKLRPTIEDQGLG